MAVQRGVTHVTDSVTAVADRLPGWARLVRARNPGPMTLDGTNTWVLRSAGASASVVVDPGPADEAHLAAVAATGPVEAVLVTHGHPDHVGGLSRFLELTGASAYRHRPGDPPADLAGLSVTALPTPGHTADSTCFLVESGDSLAASGDSPAVSGDSLAASGDSPAASGGQRAVLTGDTVLGRGTTIVAWPDGDLGDYLDSLATLTAYDGVVALPGHGPALADCAAAASYYLAHRRARLDQVAAAVAAGATTPAAVVAAVYRDLDPALRPAAEWSARAQLAYLGVGGESGTGSAPLDVP